MASWEGENHVSPEAWTALMVSRNIWTGAAGIFMALGIYFASNAATLRHEVKDLNLKLMTAQGQLSEMEYEKAKSLEMQEAGFDPDELDDCIHQETGYHNWLHHDGSNKQAEFYLSLWKNDLMEFPLNMRKEARRRLNIDTSGKIR